MFDTFFTWVGYSCVLLWFLPSDEKAPGTDANRIDVIKPQASHSKTHPSDPVSATLTWRHINPVDRA